MKTAFLAVALAVMIISVTSRSSFKERPVREYLNDLEKRGCDNGDCFHYCLFKHTESSCRKKCCDDCFADCMIRGTKADYVCRHECDIA